MADETKSLIPEGSVKIVGRDVAYSTLAAFGVGLFIGMMIKA